MTALMLSGLLRVLAIISAVLTVASIGYCMLCVWAGARFLRRRLDPHDSTDLPGISVLKPLKGSDPNLYQTLLSHCLQDYPDYEILFGITEANDAAAFEVEKLIKEFSRRKMSLVVCDKRLGANGKVSTLAQLTPLATYEFLLVNDSDIRVEADYLRTVVGELQRSGVGMVTCLYHGVAAPTLGSRLEALGIGTDFVPGVLAAWQIEKGLGFGLGSTLAFRRRELQAIGGFEAIVDYLADDYELGRRVADQGMRIELSRAVVGTHLPAYDLEGFFTHQLRWARTIRASRPAGYAGLLLTFTLPWALAALILSRGSTWAWWLFAGALLSRFCAAIISCRFVLRDRDTLRSLWLLPMRDLIGIFVWMGGLLGKKIVWRNEAFTLELGKLRKG